MKVYRWKSDKLVSVNTTKYKIDWDKAPSKGQLQLQQFLKQYLFNSIVLAEYRIPGSLSRLDIFCVTKKIVFEFDGKFHNTYVPHFHRNKLGFANTIKKDIAKEEWCEKNGIKVIRIEDKDLPLLTYDFFVKEFDVYL